jgi:NAD+ synthase (glutamine-hydrolysing)
MPKTIVGAGVLNQIPLDWEGNFGRVLALIQQAQRKSISIFCLPELCLTGYGCEDQFYSLFTEEKAWHYLEKLIPYTSNITVFVGLPITFSGQLYNVAACISHNKLIALIPKQHLANDGVHYEARWFTAWSASQRDILNKSGMKIPFGDYRIDLGKGILVGVEICQDAWEGENRPAFSLVQRGGVSLICNPTASHFAFGKSNSRKKLVCEGSEIIEGVYLFANLLGNESGRVIFDGDAYIAQNSQIIAEANRFSFADAQLIFSVVDLASKSAQGDDIITSDFPWAETSQTVITNHVHSWEHSVNIKEEEFARVISLGLFDYLRKSKSFGFVISLSGGADSSAILTLCFMALRLAEKELGFDGLKQKLSYIPWIKTVDSMHELSRKLVTTLYQGTINSSDDTRQSAKELAECLASTHFEIDIDALVNGYRTLIESVIDRSLSWDQDDITLQNVQSRVRSPSAWMLANINNALLLATSNRSEASVGYATMDGDTSGSISPIAGIDKTFLRKWLIWAETCGLDETKGISGLHRVNSLEPSAELRPIGSHQVDEDDLMPYPILNDLERLAFFDRKSPTECQEIIIERYQTKFSKEKLLEFIHLFYRLWSRNQWKRERYAPGFHVDDYSLDPKSWLRFPILSAGLEKDLPA